MVCRCGGGGGCCCCDCVWFFVDDVPVSVLSLYLVLSFWPFSPIFLLFVLSITRQSYNDIVLLLFVGDFFFLGNLPSVMYLLWAITTTLPKWAWKRTTRKRKEKNKKKIENRTHKTVTHANFYRWQNCALKRERDWHRYRPKKNRTEPNQTKWESCAFCWRYGNIIINVLDSE